MNSIINNLFINNVGKRPINITENNNNTDNNAGVLICNYSCDLRFIYSDIAPNLINITNYIGKPFNTDIKYLCLTVNDNSLYKN